MSNRTLTRTVIPAAVAAWLASCSSAAAQAQPGPPGLVNIQILPKDTTRAAVIQRMRGFSLALGVRWQYCHFGVDAVSMDGGASESVRKGTQQKRRAILRL